MFAGQRLPKISCHANIVSCVVLLKMLGFKAAACAYCDFDMLDRLHRTHALSIGGPRLCVINNVISNQSISVLS